MGLLEKAIVGMLVVVNLAGFIVTGIDKNRAKKKKWRVPEKVLFYLAVLGACPGIYTAFWVFRHKTKKWYFIYGIPLIFLIQAAVLYYLIKR